MVFALHRVRQCDRQSRDLTTIDDHDFWGFKDYGVNLLTQIAVNRGFEYLAGYDFQNYTGRDAVLVIQQQTEHVNAFFGQIRTTPDLIPDAHFALGARYNIPSVGQSALVWNGGGQYDFSKSLYSRVNFGTAFRLPTAEELFANDPDDERGDPNLKPETSTNANVSIGGIADVGLVAQMGAHRLLSRHQEFNRLCQLRSRHQSGRFWQRRRYGDHARR